MAMKTIKIAKLKANLSKVLKEVQAGESVTVFDRDHAVAEIKAVSAAPEDVWRRLAREGKVKLGTQDWGSLKLKRLGRRVPIDEILRWVREDKV
jgi:antitoxin (DNA-binding transcriptional repressor) of toxin-antitoxin stability system